MSWSPDGESIVYSSDGQIYTYNVVLGTQPRLLTFEGGNILPAFSPDGTRVAFSSSGRPENLESNNDLFVKTLDDDSPARLLIRLEANQRLTQWPSDSLLVFERAAGGRGDLWMLDLSDPENPRAEEYLTSEADLRRIVVSPDGTLAAYRSDESGRAEIYIRTFPEPGGPTRVSTDGGSIPFWSPDGSTLYYTDLLGALMAARIQRNPVPVVLSVEGLDVSLSGVEPFAGAGLHPDGDRFILALNLEGGASESGPASQLILVQNFFEELKRLVPN